MIFKLNLNAHYRLVQRVINELSDQSIVSHFARFDFSLENIFAFLCIFSLHAECCSEMFLD